jgi:hypothetical protein
MGFEVGDLVDVLQPWIHIDQYKSKMGRDDKNCVISFAVDDRGAAQDLVDFLERGYEFVLDADISNSEVSNGRYLVFAEIRRISSLYDHVEKILRDLKAASDIKPTGWRFKFMKDKDYTPLTRENFEAVVPLSSRAYRKQFIKPIEDMKNIANIPVVTPPVQDKELQSLQNLAGI